jgi:hypothetical protein
MEWRSCRGLVLVVVGTCFVVIVVREEDGYTSAKVAAGSCEVGGFGFETLVKIALVEDGQKIKH